MTDFLAYRPRSRAGAALSYDGDLVLPSSQGPWWQDRIVSRDRLRRLVSVLGVLAITAWDEDSFNTTAPFPPPILGVGEQE